MTGKAGDKIKASDAINERERVSFGNVGGQTRQKVELGALIEQLLKDIRAIDDDQEMSRGEKTKRIGRLAERLKNKLYEDRRRKEDDKLKASSYRRYLTTVRKAITAQNWRHHALQESAERLAKRHPRFAEQLLAMVAHDDITDVRIAHRDLLADIRSQGDREAYDAVRSMKLDHEVMRHLTLPAVTKAELAEEAVERLEERATNTVTINYPWLMATIRELLASQQVRAGGAVAPYFSHLALGLALATGRREVEILKLARFKKVDDFEMEFSGQAKRRGGVDYSESYRIYTLVTADVVLEAFAKLRALPEVRELQHLDNSEINHRVAKTLNTLTKRLFGSEERVFKDSRAIWARVVFETHFTRNARWDKANESVFWREMLGHEDVKTQESYKAFKIRYDEPEAPADSPSSQYANRLEALKALDDHPEIAAREALQKIHRWVKEAVSVAPDVKITQKAITLNVGSYRPVIKEYLALAADALATQNRSLESVAAEVPAEVAKAKPHLVAHSRNDGSWEAIATVNGVEVARRSGSSRIEAMRLAFEAATA